MHNQARYALFVVVVLLSTAGCSLSFRLGPKPPPYDPARDADLTLEAFWKEMKSSRDHYVVALSHGSSASIHEHGNSHGWDVPQVFDTPSKLIERQIIRDEFQNGWFLSDPAMLAPMFGWRDPDAALTALKSYERALRLRSPGNAGFGFHDDDRVLTPAQIRTIARVMRDGAADHKDEQVRLYCIWVMHLHDLTTTRDLAGWLDDKSQEVRLAAATSCATYPPEGVLNASGLPTRAYTRQEAVAYADMLSRHLDDMHPLVANQVFGDLRRTLVRQLKPPHNLASLDPPASLVEHQTPSWSHLSWHARRDGAKEIRDWWERGGREAFARHCTVYDVAAR